MIVAVSGLSGDTNAYRSVLSAVGSSEISGASRWLEAPAGSAPLPRVATTAPSAARAAATNRPRTSVLTSATPLSATARHQWVGTVGCRVTFVALAEPVHFLLRDLEVIKHH